MAAVMFNPTEFWRHPNTDEVDNERYKSHYLPPHYMTQFDVTDEIIRVLSQRLFADQSILEIGCNVGRNLAGLKDNGFTNLHGIEINPDAVELGRANFDLDGVIIHISSIEDFIEGMGSYDCIFTQSVFMHLPPTSEWIFEQVAMKANEIILTRENEGYNGKFQWARNYKDVFNKFGWHQVHYKAINKKLKLRLFEKRVKHE